MTIHVSWIDSEHTVILREFTGNWSWEEFYESQQQVNTMLNSVEHIVHQILDFSATQALPHNTLTHLRNSGRNMPENRGKSLVITKSSFYLQMYNILNKLFPGVTKHVMILDSREKAFAELQIADPSSQNAANV